MAKNTLKSAVIHFVENCVGTFTVNKVWESMTDIFGDDIPRNSIASIISREIRNNIRVIRKEKSGFVYAYKKDSKNVCIIEDTPIKEANQEPETLTSQQIGDAVIQLLNDKDKQILNLQRQVDACREQLKGERANHKAIERALREKIEVLQNAEQVNKKGFPLSEVVKFVKR